MSKLGPWGTMSSCTPPIVVAVSGGADSLCLAFLARKWHKNVIGLTVDHNLRPSSSDEAELTVKRLATFDMPCRILTLNNLKGGSAIAKRARHARYDALIEVCMEIGATDLLVAHHLLDQAETIAIRQRAKSRIDGLAGMARIVEYSSVRVVRPLLTVHPECLRARLRREGLEWVEDPSNNNLASERVRVRQVLRADSQQRDKLLETGLSAAKQRLKNEQHLVREWVNTNGVLSENGYCFLPWPTYCSTELLGHLVRVVAGRNYVPDISQAQRWLEHPKEATWGGVRFLWLKRGLHKENTQPGWLLLKEEVAIAPPQNILTLIQNQKALWDNRFKIHMNAASISQEEFYPGLFIAKLGDESVSMRKVMKRDHRFCGWPSALWRVLPALFCHEGLVALPAANFYKYLQFKECRIYFQPPQPLFRSEQF